MGSARSMAMSPSRPSRLAAILTLRPNGDAGALRRVIMTNERAVAARPGAGRRRRLGLRCRAALAGDHQIDRLGPLTLLVGLDVETDALPLRQRLQPGPFNRRDVDEDVTSAIVRLDETVAALAIEELDRTAHRHGEVSLSQLLHRRPPRRSGSAGHSQSGKGAFGTRRHSVPPAPLGAERQSQQENLDQMRARWKGACTA